MISVLWKLYTKESTFNSLRSENTGIEITKFVEFIYLYSIEFLCVVCFCFDFVFKFSLYLSEFIFQSL